MNNGSLLSIRGARVHNLQNVDLDLPKGKLIVITGLSGSGKSSIAFDTIYAEGQRRYMESLSSYARQFLGNIEKPDVTSITGLSPTLAIAQRASAKNPRSTVGTMTEIYDYLRSLYASFWKVHCPSCKKRIIKKSALQISREIRNFAKTDRWQLLAPVIKKQKGHHRNALLEIQHDGFQKVRIDGVFYSIGDALKNHIDRTEFHDIDIVLNQVVI